jgi:hypothetical protein
VVRHCATTTVEFKVQNGKVVTTGVEPLTFEKVRLTALLARVDIVGCETSVNVVMSSHPLLWLMDEDYRGRDF